VTRRSAWTLLLAVVCVLAGASVRVRTADRVVGLLTLPEVFGNGPCDRFKPSEIVLYGAPETGSVAGSIRVDTYWTFFDELNCGGLEVSVHRQGAVSALPTSEYEYEAPAAIVLEQRGRWFRLRLSDGSAWVQASDRDEYLPLQRLLEDGLTYLTESWDGMLAPAPGSDDSLRFRVPNDPRRRFIGLLELREAESARWIDGFERPERAPHPIARFQTSRLDQAVETLRRIPHELLVFDTQPGWYQVALRRSDWRESPRVWIEDGPIWRYRPIASEAESDRLSDQAWGQERFGLRVLGFRDAPGGLWVQVEVLSHPICASPPDPTVRARGWVPAHADSGEPTVWFSSRGC
jgi:hypothetical protein